MSGGRERGKEGGRWGRGSRCHLSPEFLRLTFALKVTFQIFVGDDVTAATKKASYGLQFFSMGVGVRGGGWGEGWRVGYRRPWCRRQKQQSDAESINQRATFLLMFLMIEALKNLAIAPSIFAHSF